MAHHGPHHEHQQNGQQDQDARQQALDAEQMGLFFRLAHRGLGLHGAAQLLGVLFGGERLHQLRHGLDALHGLEPQAHLQHVRHIARHGAVHGAGAGVGVRHHTLGGRHRGLPAHHAVEHRCKAVFVGIAALKLRRGILFRGRIPLVQLLAQAASGGAQAHRGVTRQTAPAVGHHPEVLRADAPVHQPDLVHGGHALKHRLQHGTGVVRAQRRALRFQPLVQRGAAQILHHRIHGVVGLHHVQHGFQPGGRGDALQRPVQVGKVHAGGLEQHLAAGLGLQDAVRAPLGRQGHRQIFLNGHPEAAQVLHAPVQDALPVQAPHLAHGVAPGQHRAHGQAAGGVAPRKHLAAVHTAVGGVGQLPHAVRTQAFLLHSSLPFVL